MQVFRIYQIEVEGRVDEQAFNAASPIQVSVSRTGAEATLFTIYTDQAGLVGLMRHLHNQGFVCLSVIRSSK